MNLRNPTAHAGGTPCRRISARSGATAAGMVKLEQHHGKPEPGKLYHVERQAVAPVLREAHVRVEKRLVGSLAVRDGERYLPVKECAREAESE